MKIERRLIELQPNTTLQNGKYLIHKVLGQGSFGITYLASMHDIGDGCELEVYVAIKEFFMREYNNRHSESYSVTGSQSELFQKYREKFKTEAKNLKKMSEYDDIVKIYDVFEENNTAYFAMEYIEGQNLDDYIKQCGKIPENQAIEYIKATAEALKHLHDSKMLHLDLKPKNIMRHSDGKLFLIDFGLSKQYDENGKAESSTTIGLGTPGYAPIEQANFKGIFAPTLDIYALGATFYKMLTGESAPDSTDIYDNGFTELREKMQSCNVSGKTVNIVEKAMKSRKSERYQSVDEFLQALPKDEDGTIITSIKPAKNRIAKIGYILYGLLILPQFLWYLASLLCGNIFTDNIPHVIMNLCSGIIGFYILLTNKNKNLIIKYMISIILGLYFIYYIIYNCIQYDYGLSIFADIHLWLFIILYVIPHLWMGIALFRKALNKK